MEEHFCNGCMIIAFDESHYGPYRKFLLKLFYSLDT